MLVVQTHLGTGPPEGEMNLLSTKSPEFGSSCSVMDCRNLLFSIKRNCEVRSSWNYSSQKTWDDPDVCLRHNLSHNLINVARLT